MRRRTMGLLLVVCWTALSLQGCVTLLGKRTQSVIVTARPAGTRVLVDGEFKGLTPLALRVPRPTPHVIRFEMDGYRPVEVRLKKRKNWTAIVLPNLIWSVLAYGPAAISGFDVDSQGQANLHKALMVVFFAATPAAMLIDGSSAKSNMLEPRHFTVTLEKDEGAGPPAVLMIDPEDFEGVTWISVLAPDRECRRYSPHGPPAPKI